MSSEEIVQEPVQETSEDFIEPIEKTKRPRTPAQIAALELARKRAADKKNKKREDALQVERENNEEIIRLRVQNDMYEKMFHEMKSPKVVAEEKPVVVEEEVTAPVQKSQPIPKYTKRQWAASLGF